MNETAPLQKQDIAQVVLVLKQILAELKAISALLVVGPPQ